MILTLLILGPFDSARSPRDPAPLLRRETLLAIPWMRTRPYMGVVVVSDVITRWISFSALMLVLYALATGRFEGRALPWSAAELALAIGGGFLVGSYLRQILHLLRHPQDFWLAPVSAVVSMWVLRPIEWYGNLTFLKQDWLTRNTATDDRAREARPRERTPALSPPF